MEFDERIELLRGWDTKTCPHCGNPYDCEMRRVSFHHILPWAVREKVSCDDLRKLGYVLCLRCHRELHCLVSSTRSEPLFSAQHVNKLVCPPGGFLPKVCGTKPYCVDCYEHSLGDTLRGRRAMNLRICQGRCPSVAEKKDETGTVI
jgi:hypothetical protein